MDLWALRRQGFTIVEIAKQLDHHRAIISKWLKQGGPPARRGVRDNERVVDEGWARRLDDLLLANPKLLSTSLFEVLAAGELREQLSERGASRARTSGSVSGRSRSERADRDRSGCRGLVRLVGLRRAG